MTSAGMLWAQGEQLGAEDRTEIECGKVSGKDVIWMPEIRTIDYVLNNEKAPILVKVDEGVMNDENDALERDEILTIYGEFRMHRIIASDKHGGRHNIPIECVDYVEILPLSEDVYRTIRDICSAVNLPGMVENTKQFMYYGQTFTAGTQFEINSVYKENNEPAGLSVICRSPKQLRIKLSLSVRGDFKEVLLPEDRGKHYMVKDLVHRKFPVCVEFLQTEDKHHQYGPHLGRVTLKKLEEVNMVSAKAHVRGEEIFKPFSRQLDVTVVIGKTIDVSHDYTSIDEKWCDDEYVVMASKACPPLEKSYTRQKDAPEEKKNTKSTNFVTRNFHKNSSSVEGKSSCPNEYKQDFSLPFGDRSKEDVNDILRYLHLEEYCMSFKENQVDAKLLISLTEQHFTSALKMTSFESTKLSMYLRGWRPMNEMSSVRGHYELDAENPMNWPVEEVSKRMQAIKLPSFAKFCLKNQVDGNLLKKIANLDNLKSIEIKFGVKLSTLDQTKLQRYIDGWRPNST